MLLDIIACLIVALAIYALCYILMVSWDFVLTVLFFCGGVYLIVWAVDHIVIRLQGF